MGRKKKGGDEMPEIKNATKKYVRLEFGPQEHGLLRRAAAFADQNMASYARNAVLRAIREDAEKFGLSNKDPKPGD